MSCEIEAGYSKPACKNNGGISALYVGNKVNVATMTLDASGDEIDTMTMVAGTKLYKLEFDMESSMATWTPTGNRDNNSLMIPLTCMGIVKDDEIDTQALTRMLMKGNHIIVAAYANGKFRVFGYQNGMSIETIQWVSGQRYEDLNGATINWVGKELIQPPFISAAKAAALLIPSS
jgi:hypothetical protein